MHIPVLRDEVIKYLSPQPNQNFIDCTLGFAGHAKAILEKNAPNGKVLGIEQDPAVFEQTKKERIDRLVLCNGSYANLKEIIEKESFRQVSAILFDLGMSSWHIDESGRGFTFQKDELLDMRFNNQLSVINNQLSVINSLTAEKIVNNWPEEKIAEILRNYGQERFARNIAKKIIETRKTKPIKTTLQLVEIIKKSFPKSYKFGKLHVATRTFQALRMAVNNELENLKTGLAQALQILEHNGKIAIISFHSLEDSIAKAFFKQEAKNSHLRIITKKPIQPTLQEIKQNPRSRPAKLRVAEKI